MFFSLFFYHYFLCKISDISATFNFAPGVPSELQYMYPTCDHFTFARFGVNYGSCNKVNIEPQPNCSIYFDCLQKAGQNYTKYQDCLQPTAQVYSYLELNNPFNVTFDKLISYNVTIYEHSNCTSLLIPDPITVYFGCYKDMLIASGGTNCNITQIISNSSDSMLDSYVLSFLF